MQAVERRPGFGAQAFDRARLLRGPALATALAALGAACGLLIASLLSHDPREAFAYVVACLMMGGAMAIGRRGGRPAPDAVEVARREVRAVAHDLRAPLVTISSYLDLLADGAFGAVTPETATALRHASGVANRTHAMVESMLHAGAGATMSPIVAPVAAVDLEDVLSEVIDALTASMRERQALVSTDGRMPLVRGDQTALFRVFENLLQNAIKFTRAGDSPRIHLHARVVEGGLVEIAVSDNGAGFRAGETRDVFVSGVRGAAAGAQPGFGIGLATVAQLVSAMGGAVSIDPPAGHGSTVRVTLRAA